ncbi:MAG: hypothetical protein H5T64_13260 [Chloroflexi bacterium]|nr:hypothetical protein [Chloroflexota bacterium]
MSIERRVEDLEARTGSVREPMIFYIRRPGGPSSEEARRTALAKAMQERPDQSIYIVVLEGGEQNVNTNNA